MLNSSWRMRDSSTILHVGLHVNKTSWVQSAIRLPASSAFSFCPLSSSPVPSFQILMNERGHCSLLQGSGLPLRHKLLPSSR